MTPTQLAKIQEFKNKITLLEEQLATAKENRDYYRQKYTDLSTRIAILETENKKLDATVENRDSELNNCINRITFLEDYISKANETNTKEGVETFIPHQYEVNQKLIWKDWAVGTSMASVGRTRR